MHYKMKPVLGWTMLSLAKQYSSLTHQLTVLFSIALHQQGGMVLSMIIHII